MSERHDDDEILGRALSRAIDTQDVEGTPYERSRLAVRPLRRGLPLWQVLGAAAVLVLAVAFGAWFTRPTAPAVATSPSPSAVVTASPNATPTPAATATTFPDQAMYLYFARDGLPPIGSYVSAPFDGTDAQTRILSRVDALHNVSSKNVPANTTDYFGVGVGPKSYVATVRVSGELATLEFQFPLPDKWNVSTNVAARGLLQELVYTVTEEPGVTRVLITEQGRGAATIGSLVVDKPLGRDDVSGYTATAPTGTTEFDGSTKLPNVTGDVVSREIVDGTLVRYTFVGSDRAHNAAKADLPPFSVSFFPNDRTGNDPRPPAYVLTVAFHVNAQGEFGAVGHVEYVDRSPLRRVTSSDAMYVLGLDDGRPWRVYEPDPQHLVLEVGGDPRTVSDRIAVNDPAPNGTVDTRVSRTVTLAGLARTFEANVVWRVKDTTNKVVATGHTTASIGTSNFWGTFSTAVTLPSNLSGNVTLEVYEVSPKDGTEQGVVTVPLVVR